MVSDGLGKTGKIIYFEDSCLPMKLLVTHAVSLREKVDHLFIPRLVSVHRIYIMCPKFRGAPDVVRLATEGKISIIDETIDLQSREYSILQSFLRIGERLGASKKEARQAFKKGEQALSQFKKESIDRIHLLPLKDLFQLKMPPPKKGKESTLRVAFVGHPYNLFDRDINKDVLTLTKNLGIEIFTPDSLSEKEIDRQIADLSKEIYWSSGREIVGALFHFLKGGVDGVVFLTSFKCGIDALLQEFIKRSLKIQGGTTVPFLVLSFDEHTGREGLVTRLEAFKDVMEQRKAPNSKHQIPNKSQ
jgi:predicted nucleotide-binding protein (sugar kinase/HSP70/actin superfamily)